MSKMWHPKQLKSDRWRWIHVKISDQISFFANQFKVCVFCFSSHKKTKTLISFVCCYNSGDSCLIQPGIFFSQKQWHLIFIDLDKYWFWLFFWCTISWRSKASIFHDISIQNSDHMLHIWIHEKEKRKITKPHILSCLWSICWVYVKKTFISIWLKWEKKPTNYAS